MSPSKYDLDIKVITYRKLHQRHIIFFVRVIKLIEEYEAYCDECDLTPEHGGYRSQAANADDPNKYINVCDSEAVDSSQHYYNEPNVTSMNPNDFPISADAALQCPKGISD